ncbi:MAG: periplasmic heavy metal sensor [Bacteroidia bacterium]|nr:periplasmic heavy metal sensor [Bacteroidia bacterium]
MTTYLKNNKTLIFIITVLFISNLVMLFSFVRKDKDKSDNDRSRVSAREVMVQTLRDSIGFNEEQLTKYEELANKHKEVIKPMFESIRQSKEDLYKLLLQSNVPDSIVNNYLDRIGEGQRNIDEKVYRHFSSLRELCSTEQRPQFDSVTQKIIKRMISPSRKGGHNDKDKSKK